MSRFIENYAKARSVRSRVRTGRAPSPFVMQGLEERVLLSSTLTGFNDILTGSEIAGWAFNSATPNTPVTVEISIDGAAPIDVTANQSRPDLKPITGTDKVGYFYVPTVAPGTHTVTVSELDSTTNTTQVITTGTIKSGPIGNVDFLSGGIILGWAFSSAAPQADLTMHITIDGTVHTTTTGASRPDAGDPLGNPNVGFFFNPPVLSAGDHPTTVAVVDPQTGQDVVLATGSINSNPIGYMDVATLSHIQGWAYDPKIGNNPVNLEVDVDDVLNTTAVANNSRPDLDALFNNDGDHGFSINLNPVSAGAHTIKVYQVNSDSTKTLVLTKTLDDTVIGNLDLATPGVAAGWAFDPINPSAHVQVQYYLDGVLSDTETASTPRADLTVLPSTDHSFFSSMPTNLTGTHTFVVKAINPDTGVLTILGSTTFTNHAPTGVIQAFSGTGVTGWAYDPDEPTTPVAILVSLDNASNVIANGTADIDQPALVATIGSSNHGFDIPFTGISGTHTLIISAVDPDTGVSTTIGTETITV